MSLPDLPTPFGNNALRGLVEIVPPDSVSWIPQTKGWLVVLLIASGLLIRLGFRRLKAWFDDRYRREAEKRVIALEKSSTPETFLSELNSLLKLTAISAFSREEVAALSGASWPAFLNAQCSAEPFGSEHRHWLANGLYRGDIPSNAEKDELARAAKQWIRQHRRPADA